MHSQLSRVATGYFQDSSVREHANKTVIADCVCYMILFFSNRHFTPDFLETAEDYQDWWDLHQNQNPSLSNVQTFVNSETRDSFVLYFYPRDKKLYLTCKTTPKTCKLYIDDAGDSVIHTEFSESLYFLLTQTKLSHLTSNFQHLNKKHWHFCGLFSTFPNFLKDEYVVKSDTSIIEDWYLRFDPIGAVMLCPNK